MNKAAAAKGEPATKKTAQYAQNKQEIINHKTERKKMSRTINFSIDDGEVLIMRDKVNVAHVKGNTIKVWLNNDTPYEFNYENREEAKEDFAKFKKYLNEDDEKIINEKLIDKACEWLSQTYFCRYYNKEFIDIFRKAMEE